MGGGSSKSQEAEGSPAKKRREGRKTSKSGSGKAFSFLNIADSHEYSASQRDYIEAIFASLPHSNAKKFDDLLKILKVEKHNRGEIIVYEEQIGSKLYIVGEGRLEASVDGTFLRSFEEGDHFGDLSVIHHLPYGIKVIVQSVEVKLFVVDGVEIQKLQSEIIHDDIYRLSGLFSQMPELETFPVDKLSYLASHVHEETYVAGEEIREPGKRSDSIFLIEEGEACIELSNDIVLQINEHHVHTAVTSMRDSMHKISAAEQDVSNHQLHWSEIDKFLGIIRAEYEDWTDEERQKYTNYEHYDSDQFENLTKCTLKVGCIIGNKILRGKAGGNLNGWVWHDCHEQSTGELTKGREKASNAGFPIKTAPSNFSESFRDEFLDHSGADYPYTVTALSDVKIVYFTIS